MATDKQTKKNVAIKQILKSKLVEETYTLTLNEIDILKACNH